MTRGVGDRHRPHATTAAGPPTPRRAGSNLPDSAPDAMRRASPAGLLAALASETMKVDSRRETQLGDVRFRLLGPMEVWVDGAPVKLPGTAERALLAQLLLSPGRTIPATMLVDRLWSESTLPVDPMNALQIRVSKLRRALKAMGVGDVVTREGVGYRASIDASTVDVLDFADRIRTARAAAANARRQRRYRPGPRAGLRRRARVVAR